ncbi:PREDICTED: probable 2-carboxy-D-arabinitol-1-phosphatase isoform X2 [Tarenaya hassleriana]|uniref:probable 2-carboxy-D-arabinitol-1-phosphatase isoform X2 n=1 Tax=Tarenaya hassleriana TaxID=28532 RepID=UPI00053C68F2|nr:PREDICTED: probable 2-carboxy-D-arabinitol-1-phosphatase isoform X2 [Tarenaya hassleriana]
MACGVSSSSLVLHPNLTSSNSLHRQRLRHHHHHAIPKIICQIGSSRDSSVSTDEVRNVRPLTGGAYGFEKATTSLTRKALSCPKRVTLIRHGLSSWNEEGRIQGSSNKSVLTEIGKAQARRCREALEDIHFDRCFSSPISRAKTTAELMWEGREEPLVFLDSLMEAHVFFLEGMRNEMGGSGC